MFPCSSYILPPAVLRSLGMLPGAAISLIYFLGRDPSKVVRRVPILDVDAELDGSVAICEFVGIVTDDEDEP